MKRGIYIVSCGETDAFLPALLASIVKHSGLPVHIERDLEAGGIKSREYKLAMCRNSPFGQTLYVDTDTLLNADPEPLFDLLRREPLWMCIDVGPRTVGEVLQHKFFKEQLHASSAKVALEKACETWADMPHFNSGVVLFDKDAGKFFEAWSTAWHDHPPGQDQVAMMIAMHESRIRPASLSPRWNWQHSHKMPEQDLVTHRNDIKLLHLLGPNKPELYRRAKQHGYLTL